MEILNDLNTSNLKQIFWKTKAIFKKIEYRFCFFFGFRSLAENAWFPFKTAVSETSVKSNRIVSTKLFNHKERIFTSNYFIFLKILFQFKNLS